MNRRLLTLWVGLIALLAGLSLPLSAQEIINQPVLPADTNGMSEATGELVEALDERDALTEPEEEKKEQRDPLEVTPARDAMYQGMVLAQDGKHEEAIIKLEWAIREDPTLIGAWETLGWSYWLTDRRKDAEALWRRLVVIAPNEPMGYNLLAQISTRDGRFKEAESLYETSLRLNPDQYETRLNLARVLLWSGNFARAKALLAKLFEEDPARVDVEIELAWAMYANEEYEDVIQHWNNINEAIPDNPTFLLARANVLVLIGSLDEAEVDARKVLELEPRNPGAIDLIVTLAMQKEDPTTAVEALKESMENAEDDRTKAKIANRAAAYMKSLVDADSDLYSRGDVLDMIQTSLDYDDYPVETHLFKGEMLLMDKQFAAAAGVFEEILEEMNPHNERARFGLLESYLGRAMYEEAEQQIRENFSLINPNNPFRHYFWARLYFSQGNTAAALEALDRLEYEGSKGAVFSLVYHGLSPSEFSPMPSVRQLQEQLMALRRDGFRFITPSELPLYFDQAKGAELTDERPWLFRLLQSIKYAWTGKKQEELPKLSDYTPDKVVMVTFDDGLRNSLRYGSQVAEDLGIRMTMFVGVGDVLSPNQRYVATFPELREFQETGNWEIHSHLWDAGQLLPVDENGRNGLPLVNRLWLTDRERLESLREYQQRLRREFRESKRVLMRELELDESDLSAVAYPFGEIGTEYTSNIRAFRVPEVVLNEAEISYKMGFVQNAFGYTMKTDDRMLYKRWEPRRSATGREVLMQAYLQHPVFVARRMRAEIAGLSGRLHLANDNLALLRRDGYPEEEYKELSDQVIRTLGRLVPLPEGVEDLTTSTDEGGEPLVSFRKPYIGAELDVTRANVMIDDREGTIFGGLNISRRLGLQVRFGSGQIRQTVTTNQFIETTKTSTETTFTTEERIEDGEVSNVQVTSSETVTRTILSNKIYKTTYRADKTYVGAAMNYTHDSGSFTLADFGLYSVSGDDMEDEGGDAFVFGLEHQWRPAPAIDMMGRFYHGVVPSARRLITYDSLAIRPFWRIRDGWQANGIGYFAFYDDRNSYLKVEVENYWVLSHQQDIWMGFRSSVDTVDRDSDYYWSPYWDQRHAAVLRLRRSFPDYFGQLKIHLGIQKTKPRQEDLDELAAATSQGYEASSSLSEKWEDMMGFAGSVTRKFQSGFELTGEFSVNAGAEYTEHTALLRLMYTF